MIAEQDRERAELAAIALVVGTEAGQLVLAGHRSQPHADRKARGELVTDFDRASQDLVMARLGSLTPGIPIVGEERTAEHQDGTVPGSKRRLVWYVDPLDGTTNFVHGHPFWCVAVGLSLDGEPIAGAVVAPAIGVTWSGWRPADPSRSGEAQRNGAACRVSGTTAFADALLATGFPTAHATGLVDLDIVSALAAIKRDSQALRRCGSAAMDLCMVGDGTYDGYWDRGLRAWDAAAAAAIVLAAGGTITSFDATPVDWRRANLVATNGLIHAELLAALGKDRSP